MTLTIGRIGFRAGLAAFTARVACDVVQLLQVFGALMLRRAHTRGIAT